MLQPGDIEDGRLKHGAVALAEILDEIAARAPSRRCPTTATRCSSTFAHASKPAGCGSHSATAASSGWSPRTAARASSSRPTRVLTGRSLRESLRLRPEVLRRLGWHYARVHAFELFADPEAVADRIARLAGLAGGAAHRRRSRSLQQHTAELDARASARRPPGRAIAAA